MSAGGSISAMIASMKNNSRRKNKHIPFSTDNPTYKKGEAIKSKKFTKNEKEKLLEKIRSDHDKENKLRIYKLFISLGLTIVFIVGFVFIIKNVFF